MSAKSLILAGALVSAYALVIVPFGLLLRLLRIDPLRRRRNAHVHSYWVLRDGAPVHDVERVGDTISSFNVFAQVYVMTVGSQTAPGNALRVLVYDIYTNAFQPRPRRGLFGFGR